MGCDYHQFFTKYDCENGKIVFIDPFGIVIEKTELSKKTSSFIREVSADYVLTCTVDESVSVFNFWLLRYADMYIDGIPDIDGKITKAKYASRLNDGEFNKLDFCPDEIYARHFDRRFENRFLFPECCRSVFNRLKRTYAEVRKTGSKQMESSVRMLSDEIIKKCRDLIMQSDFSQQTFYDVEYSSSHIGVYPKYGYDANVINATTC